MRCPRASHREINAPRLSKPASIAPRKRSRATGFARRYRARDCRVLLGHQAPPGYRHMAHNKTAMTATDHGMLGDVFRLATSRPVQTDWETRVARNATRQKRTTEPTRCATDLDSALGCGGGLGNLTWSSQRSVSESIASARRRAMTFRGIYL